MKYENQSMQQQIEAYLRQEMTDLERSGFERRMHDDAELHEEVQKQEAIIGAIRLERVLALKSGLQNVSVSLWSSSLLEMAKIAAVTVGLGLASAGGYWYYQQLESKRPATVIENNNPVIQQPSIQYSPESSGIVAAKKETDQIELLTQNHPVQVEQTAPAGEVNAAGTDHPETSFPQVAESSNIVRKESRLPQEGEAQEPLMKTGQPETPKDFGLPEDGISNKTKPESIQPEVVIKRDNKEKFHYQFSDGKLVLYADFSNKLYEVLELNQYGERQLYLAFDGKFFALDSQVSEISPLREVKDKNLIQILTDYQKRK